MLQSNDFENLSEVNYDKDMILLKSALTLLKSQCEESEPAKFHEKILVNLLKVLCQWARYSPDYPFVVKIKPLPFKTEMNAASTIKQLPSNRLISSDMDLTEDINTPDEDSINILNSFYIKDIEKAVNYIANQEHPILETFINGSTEKNDILIPDNEALLLNQLEPKRINLGRWPLPNYFQMSLMQQFCINECFNTHPLLSTNGPPGTGKTTLLKEIIAENVVRRARNLVDFTNVKDCFSERKIVMVGSKEVLISYLKPELTGFEILVASSNNSAVENITRELPLKMNLGKEYKESCHYLFPVAMKLAANHYKNSVFPIPPHLHPWGLIAVALGNANNRDEFIQRFFFHPDNDSKMADRIQKGQYLTIWEWRNHYKGKCFAQAKIHFMKAWSQAEDYRQKLQKLAQYHQQRLDNAWGKKIAEEQEIINNLQHSGRSVEKKKKQTEQSMRVIEQHLNILYKEIEKHLQFKPSLWKYLFRMDEVRQFNQLLKQMKTRRLQLTDELMQLQKTLITLERCLIEEHSAMESSREKIKNYADEQEEAGLIYQQLKNSFGKINLPGKEVTENDQINGYWQTEVFNQLRSQLFICALELHEAWLAEALQKKHFGGNLVAIQALLEGKSPLKTADELAIWQSLFMLIPVVSSTFASIARQFKNVPAKSLGWLLIDEAGQAIPQAAIGALWRCKKAMVVGDPRQIEPIMTIPFHLIEGVAKHHFSSINPYWLPHITSIQRLADLASPLGSIMQQGQQQEWIGIPLLVHRRCLEPMFSVANTIAYENKMINARRPPAEQKLTLPESVWFDVPGIATDKQYVPTQGDCLLQLFIWFFNAERGLPQLFIITPFKRIRKYLKEIILHQPNWISKIDQDIIPPSHRDLQKWLNKHVGTVHTFQGKEIEKVIFVLGADKEQKGAIHWASSKPNLLNVALTRATDRIYIIGEWEIWANRQFFNQASKSLEKKEWAGLRQNQCAL